METKYILGSTFGSTLENILILFDKRTLFIVFKLKIGKKIIFKINHLL